MTSTEQHYMYRPVNGGIEIPNGNGRFDRALYTSIERAGRIVALAGDRPDFMLIELPGKGSLFKLGNLKLGFAGESWLSVIEPVNPMYSLLRCRTLADKLMLYCMKLILAKRRKFNL